MRTTPTDPTAALAALITANHRVVARQAMSNASSESEPRAGLLEHAHEGARGDVTVESRRRGRAFLAVMPLDVDPLGLSGAFELTADALRLVEWGGSGGAAFEAAVSAPGIILFLVAVRLLDARAGANTFQQAESEAFMGLDAAIRNSTSLRAALVGRRIRAVAMALEHGSRRVHWLGEHPRQSELVRGARSPS